MQNEDNVYISSVVCLLGLNVITFVIGLEKGLVHGKVQISDMMMFVFSTHHKHLEGRKGLVLFSTILHRTYSNAWLMVQSE